MKILLATSLLVGPAAQSSPPTWLSPAALVASPDGANLYIACATGNRVLVFNTSSRKVTRSVPVAPNPAGLCVSADGQKLFVTCAAAVSRICLMDTAQGRVTTELPAGHSAMAPALSPDGKTLFVCNRFDDSVSMLNLAMGGGMRRIPVRREPVAAAIAPDGQRLLVANHLPAGRANASHAAAVISVIDPAVGRVVDELSLPNGSGGLNDLRISPDGKYAVVTHILARFQRPTTQVERGWMNSNAGTIIDLTRMAVVNTVLLDEPDRGAANPWGAAWSADSRTLVIAHAGTHEASVINFPAMLAKLAKLTPEPLSANAPPAYGARARAPADVANDLSFLAGLRERRPLPAGDLGPRAVVVVGRQAYAANYYSDTLSVLELDGPHPRVETIPLGPKPRMTAARQETRCAQCHPPPLFTNLKAYDVGTRGPLDGEADTFDTPTLIELWRTAPYLHDGSVATLRDLLTLGNQDDRHGRTSHLTADQIRDLCEYLLSL